MSIRILWKGQWKDVDGLTDVASEIAMATSSSLNHPMQPLELLRACDAVATSILRGEHPEFEQALLSLGMPGDKVKAALEAVASVLKRENLERKYQREFGGIEPFIPQRPDFREPILEAWFPLGVLLHVVPSNSPTVAPLSVVEGLMAGNVNILKNTARNGEFPMLLLKAISDADPSGNVAPLLFAMTVSSSDERVMHELYEASDAVAVWGGDAAVSAVRSATGAHVKVVEWGHKISFSCFSREVLQDQMAMEAVARDVCVIEQQACSSPQCILVETDDASELHAFALHFSDVLAIVSREYPQAQPSAAEAAEITTTCLMAEYDACLGKGDVISDDTHTWRILVKDEPGLMPSPLYRTVWVVPFSRSGLTDALRPYRGYLQTASLACAPIEVAEMTTMLFRCGVTRVVCPGDMLGEYAGQPHDGVYALQRYARRVSVNRASDLVGIAGFHDFYEPAALPGDARIMSKQDFVSTPPNERLAGVYFKSGGTTGVPKASAFSWDDYAEQMAAAAEGLVAAGLNPATDRCANLYYCGGMYGSFISFWSVLEHAKAVQLPIAMLNDFAEIMEYIIRFKANTILAMPFFAIQLFESQADRIIEYGGIKKLFLSGEHISESVKEDFRDKYGVQLVTSAIYGSNDAGVIGYTCPHCGPSVFHIMDRLQHVEIVDLEKDKPVGPGGEGRVIVSTRNRKAVNIRRYDIGDLARRVEEPCPCGRKAPRIQLLGRHGDVFKVGPLFQISAFTKALETIGYTRKMQIVLSKQDNKSLITIRLEKGQVAPEAALAALMGNVPGLSIVLSGHIGVVEIESISPGEFEVNPSSGKFVSLLDRRINS